MTLIHRIAAPLVCLALGAAAGPAAAQSGPIRIGVPTAIQVQVGRDTIDSLQMGIDEINAKGGVLGRKLELVIADETENPEAGINAVKKLTADDKVDVLIGGYTSGVTLAQLPHIARAKTIYLGIGAASPSITQRVKQDYDNYKYIFRVNPINAAHQARAVADYISGFVMGEMGWKKIAIIGENAKWVQDLVPVLKKGAVDAGADVRLAEFFDTQTSDFSPLLAKVKESEAQYLIVILSHGSSDVFVKQWYDARFPVPIGGIDVKSMDADFFKRVGGKSISETTINGGARTDHAEDDSVLGCVREEDRPRRSGVHGTGSLRCVVCVCRSGQAREDDRCRRGDQGAREDRLRRCARAHPVRRLARREGGAGVLEFRLRAVAGQRHARDHLAEGDADGEGDIAAVGEEVGTRDEGLGTTVIVRGIENRWSRRNAFVLSVVMTGTESKQLGVLGPSTLQPALRRSGRTVGSICLSTLQLALRRSGRTVGSICLPTLQLALRRSQETASPADSAMARCPLPSLKKGDRGGFYL
jgi:ABC-type branched-subunit amino acid transport system substrate-binding protein